MQDYLLALGLAICLITDLKERKIYNIVLLPLLLFGLIYNLATGGFTGLWQSILGTLTGLAILFIPFALGGIGAGDVKLLAVIGAVKGPIFVLYAAIAMGLAGGLIASVILIFQGRFLHTIMGFFHGVWIMLVSRFKIFEFGVDNEKIMLPYGLAIVLGTLGAYCWMR